MTILEPPTPPVEPGERVGAVYGWVMVDADGNEQIASIHAEGDITLPLLSPDSSRMRRFIPTVRRAARDLGRPARLVRFVREEVIAEAEPT